MTRPAVFLIGGMAFITAGLMLAGCGSSSSSEPRDLMAEEARDGGPVDRPVAMKGDALFADGSIHVLATVARGFQRMGKNGGMARGEAPRKESRWFKHDTDAYSENYNFDYGDSDEEQKEAVQDYIRQAMARRAAGSPMPPVTLHVTFENRGQQPLEVVPVDVNSDLGNFAARPEKLTIEPGQKAALDPMISQLGVTSDDIPLTLTLKVGAKKETQVIHIKNILAPAIRDMTVPPAK